MVFGHICIPPKLIGGTGVAARRLKQPALAEYRGSVLLFGETECSLQDFTFSPLPQRYLH